MTADRWRLENPVKPSPIMRGVQLKVNNLSIQQWVVRLFCV